MTELTEDTGRQSRRSGISAAFGLAGAVVGAVAAGAAAGVAAERYAVKRRRRRAGDPYADEPFGQLPSDEAFTLTTSDGVDLHVEVVEPPDGPADLTVVFVHGFCLDMGTWHFQRTALDPRRQRAPGDSEPGVAQAAVDGRVRGSRAWRAGTRRGKADPSAAPRVRMVFYDQPGHGRSGRHPRGDYRLDQLGAGLGELIAEVAPDGPLVLAGHSMGGMAIMALAEQQPDLIVDRVTGVALVSTSAGHLDDVSLGLPPVVARFRGALMPTVGRLLRWQPNVAEFGRRAGSDLAYLLTRRYGFGTESPSPTLVEYVEAMNASTSVEVIARYFATLSEHDRYASLEAFAELETLVVCGEKDMLTPVEHTREIASLLPRATLLEVADGGHCTVLEHADLVNEAFADLLRRAARPRSRRPARRGRELAARVARQDKAAHSGPQQQGALRRILRRKGA